MTDEDRTDRWLPKGAGILAWPGRRRLRDYLDRLHHAVQIKDLNARETGLGEIRSALRADLVKGEISDGHYLVAMGHLDEAIKYTRIESIEQTFQELPFHIVETLQGVLDDGRIDPDEMKMVENLLEQEDLPMEDRNRVLARLGRWQLSDEAANV